MFLKLLYLEWKAFFRSANFAKGLAVKALLGFLGLYFLIVFVSLGIGLYPASKKLFPNEEPLLLINQYLLVWFAMEMFIRFLMQNLPVVDTKPLLIQRIPKSKIIHVLLLKSIVSFYNFLTPLVVIPFVIINAIKSEFSLLSLIGWLVAVIGVIIALNYLNFWLQRKFSANLKALLPIILFCLLLTGLQYFGVFSITNLFGKFFNLILDFPVLGILPLGLAWFSYWFVYKDITSNFYLDSYLENKNKTYRASDLSWTNRFGDLGPFLSLDLKLIWRNKRAKTALYMSFGFLAYGLLFYTNPRYADSGMLIFVGVFITGIFIINFGQFIPAWDSSYFPLLQTRPITMQKYLEAKALLMYASIVILTILSTAYIYFGWHIVYMNIACAIYNAGVNVPILLLFGAYNRKQIDLSNASMFNYQGVGAAQWLVGIPLLIVPIVIWFPVKTFVDQNTANLVLIGIGVIGLLLRKVILNGIVGLYLENRFKMIEGFQQKNN